MMVETEDKNKVYSMKVLGITKFRDEDNLMVDLIKCLEEMKE